MIEDMFIQLVKQELENQHFSNLIEQDILNGDGVSIIILMGFGENILGKIPEKIERCCFV